MNRCRHRQPPACLRLAAEDLALLLRLAAKDLALLLGLATEDLTLLLGLKPQALSLLFLLAPTLFTHIVLLPVHAVAARQFLLTKGLGLLSRLSVKAISVGPEAVGASLEGSGGLASLDLRLCLGDIRLIRPALLFGQLGPQPLDLKAVCCGRSELRL